MAWFNDLVSWPKELARGDGHNLVLVVRKEGGLSLDAAVRDAVARHNNEVREFLAVRTALHPELLAMPTVRHFVEGLTHWIRGNVDWSGETGRYRVDEDRLPTAVDLAFTDVDQGS